MKQLLFVLSLCICSLAHAQDKHVVTIGETYVDYPIDDFNFKQLKEMDIQAHFKTKLLKLTIGEQLDEYFNISRNSNLAHYISSEEFLYSNDVAIYKDADLSKPLNKEEIDQIRSFPSRALSKPNEVKVNLFNLRHATFKALRVKGKVEYNKSTHIFTFTPIAFAPLAINKIDANKGKDGEKILQPTPFHHPQSNALVPLFWIKPNYNLMENFSYNDENIIIVRRMIRSINMKDMGKREKNMKDYVDYIKSNQEKLLLYGLKPFNTAYKAAPLSQADKDEILNSTIRDTIITFDPVDFVEIPYYMATTFDAEHIESIQFVHQWAWDDKNKRLYMKQTGIMPELTRPLEEGSAEQKTLSRWPEFFMATP